MFEEPKPTFNPETIIQKINECDEIKMVKIYIYKIIYNLNNKQIDVFLNETTKEKYKFDKYNNYHDFIKDIEQINEGNQNPIYDNGNYKDIYNKLFECQKESFENEITKSDICSDEKLNFDDFFMVANNLILVKLKKKDFENDDIYKNFYNNVWEPLFKNEEEGEDDENYKLLTMIKLLFESEKYKEIKEEYEIAPKDIEVLLYGYRYCLNEIANEYKNNDKDYIYINLYDQYKLDYLDEKFYPGSDTKEEPYYELYNQIENHFREKPNQGCYICLCEKGYYHSVPSGFPGYHEINLKCPKCGKDIGAKEIYYEEKDEKDDKVKLYKIYETINRENYIRIFLYNDEIDTLNLDRDKYDKIKVLNHMIKEDFKERYIIPLYNKEKGLHKINKNNYKKENRKIRNLSQISYRLLCYILYSHLFFAKLYTNSDDLNNYLPEGMTWFNTIKECFQLLKKELEKNDITQVEIFMNFVFKDLFKKLHGKECINNYEDLITFENELDKIILEKLNKVKEEINKYKESEKKILTDPTSWIALLKEIYDKNSYDFIKYPYYEHFYYTAYLDEEYIDNKLEIMDKNEYPILSKYMEKKNQEKNKDKYSLNNLKIFNKVLNLFSEEYSNKITREKAESTIIKESDIYAKNTEDNQILIEDFIDLYNSLGEEDENGKTIELNIDKNCICDFLLIDDYKYGKSYKKIYETFIKKQNEELEELLNQKIKLGIFNDNCKNRISVQQIKDDEIFTFKIPKKFNFISVLCESSYRKVIDTKNYENYNEYEINMHLIESTMTDLLLKNKKLLNDELIGCKYNNEVFTYEITDLIHSFKYRNMSLSIDDKVSIYNYIKANDGNNKKYQTIIDDFITLIKHLNKSKKEENNKINENTKICDIDIIKTLKNISNDFKNIFDENKDIVVNKIPNLFDYYLKLIFKYIKKDMEKYQEKKEIKKEDDKDKKVKEKKEGKKGEEKEKENIKEKTKIYLDEKIINKLEEIFKEEDIIITKKSLASAIRLFISLVLYREKEKDKDKKIKENRKNIIEY